MVAGGSGELKFYIKIGHKCAEEVSKKQRMVVGIRIEREVREECVGSGSGSVCARRVGRWPRCPPPSPPFFL